MWENAVPGELNTCDALIIKYCEGLSEMTPGPTVHEASAIEWDPRAIPVLLGTGAETARQSHRQSA